MEVIPVLKRLSEACGVSGYEDAVREIVSDIYAPLADELRTDAIGNLIALKRGSGQSEPRRRLMLAGHMDEIGLMVTRLDKGFLRFTQVGGFDVRTLMGQEVLVHGRQPLPGIIGCRPPHVLSPKDREKAMPMDDLFIDVGLSPARLSELVRVGDWITVRRSFTELKNGRVSGKAFDDRAAVVAIAICLDTLQRLDHDWDVYAVATVQEEVGVRGAITSTFGVMPDIGIAIDVGFGKQPGVPPNVAIELDKGPAITMGPNLHPAVVEGLVAVAKEHEIPYQIEVDPSGTGTDANAIQLTREGIPTGLISIPLKSMHTPIETISTKDLVRIGRLLAYYIASLDGESMDKLSWESMSESQEKKKGAAQ